MSLFKSNLLVLSLSTLSFSASAIASPLNVVVSGTRSLISDEMMGKSVTVITHQQIAASGASNVFEALRSSGRVQITQNYTGNSNDGVISMRGFGENSGQNVLVLVDGRPLNNPTLEAPDLSIIPLDTVERIEILQGSAGVLYGQNAVGGVVNIITQPIEVTSGKLQLSAGSYDSQNIAAHFNHRYSNGVGIRLNVKDAQSDGYRDNSDSEYQQLLGGLSYRYAQGEIGISQQIINNNQRLPGSLTDAQIASDRRAAGTPNDFFNADVRVTELSVSHQLNDIFQLNAEASQRDSNGSGLLYASSYPQDTRVNTFTPRLTGKFPTLNGDIIFTTGFDYKASDFQAWNYYDSQQTAKAYYAQIAYPITSELSAIVGGRNTQVKDKDFANDKINSESAFVKELGLNWRVHPNHTLFLRRDENVRFAAIEENGYTLPGIAFLQPQKGVSWELGWQGNYEQTKLTANLYHLSLNDEIMYDSEANGGFGANLNLDRSVRKGVVLGAEHTVMSGLQLGATYTYTNAKLLEGSFAGNEVPFVARHMMNLFANYQFDPQWNLYVDGQFTGSRYLAGDDANASEKVDAFVVMNASLKWQHDQWTTQFTINNLLDEEYDAYAGTSYGTAYHYTAPGRNFLLSTAYSF